MVSKGNQDLLVNLGIVVLVIVVIYVVIIRNPNALNWLRGLSIGTSKTDVAVGSGIEVEGVDMIHKSEGQPVKLGKRGSRSKVEWARAQM